MYFKILIVSVILAVCHAGLIVDQGHGQALSSQSIVRHDQPSLIQHSSPLIQHGAPLIQQGASLIQHGAPLIQHGPPLIQHSSPIYQQSISGPIVQPSLIHTAQPPLIHSTPIQQVSAIGHSPIPESVPAHYEFSYSVDDPHTGDHKSQRESREGNVVKGEYSLLQPDGAVRRVEYSADDHSGFNAIVHTSAPAAHAVPAPAHVVPSQAILAHH